MAAPRAIRIRPACADEAFYWRLGAVRLGDAPSDAIQGRRLPRLEFAITDQGEARVS